MHRYVCLLTEYLKEAFNVRETKLLAAIVITG